MNIIFISEHYYPRIGGVTSYVKSMVEFAHLQFENVYLIVPSENERGFIEIKDYENSQQISIGVGTKLTGNIKPETRREFILLAEEYLLNTVETIKYDVIHILYGLYTMKYLNFKLFKELGIKIGVTIHNVPPAECGVSWIGDTIFNYIKDKLRNYFVGYVNKMRIKSQQFDFYVVPSLHVKTLLTPIIAPDKIHVVHHGFNSNLEETEYKRKEGVLQILCVSGFVPHKRQDLLIEIATSFEKMGYKINWVLVGPVRNERYFKYISDRRLPNIFIQNSISNQELHNYYMSSDIYIQPSIEEGFCLTVLEAAAYGLPIIGTKTGAIPEIIQLGSGISTNFDRNSIEEALKIMLKNQESYKNKAKSNSKNVFVHFTWEKSIRAYKSILENLS